MTPCRECGQPAKHEVRHQGDVIGPHCCDCAEYLMRRLALTVQPFTDGVSGYVRWREYHRASCDWRP